MSTIYRITGDLLTAIANAIRAKTGGSSSMTPAEMATEIANIPTGGADSRVAVFASDAAPDNNILKLNDITTLRNYACYYLRNAQNTGFDVEMSQVTRIPLYCFAYSNVANVDAPLVSEVGQYGFAYASRLTSFNFQPTRINDYAFTNCSALTSIDLSGTTVLGISSFSNCNALASVTLSNQLNQINNSCFANDRALGMITIPHSVTSILATAFNNCISMSGQLVIPSAVNSIGNKAFGGCTGLTSVKFKGTPTGTIHAQAFSGSSNITDIYVPWSSGAVANAPWGATNATIHYNSAT